MSPPNDAARFIEQLTAQGSPEEKQKTLRYFKQTEGDEFIGVRMGQVFALAKANIDMPPDEIEKLLENPIHEVRAGGLSIMNQQARRKKTPESLRKELFELYLRRHDRINNWDLVDLAAPYVVGGYLHDKPRDVLYTLVKSGNMWERRTAIIATLYFLKRGETADSLKIAELLLSNDQDLIHKATGWALRVAGDVDRPQLITFLDQHAATMPRTTLRYALEHFDKPERDYYMGLKKSR